MSSIDLSRCFSSSSFPLASSPMHAIAFRLKPASDLVECLEYFLQKQEIHAACILSAVGSFTQVRLRLANKSEEHALVKQGHFELVSLTGCMASHNKPLLQTASASTSTSTSSSTSDVDLLPSYHLHMSISDGHGTTFGGHLLKGNLVYTTLELVIGIMPQFVFRRELDPTFGYDELVVYKKKETETATTTTTTTTTTTEEESGPK